MQITDRLTNSNMERIRAMTFNTRGLFGDRSPTTPLRWEEISLNSVLDTMLACRLYFFKFTCFYSLEIPDLPRKNPLEFRGYCFCCCSGASGCLSNDVSGLYQKTPLKVWILVLLYSCFYTVSLSDNGNRPPIMH